MENERRLSKEYATGRAFRVDDFKWPYHRRVEIGGIREIGEIGGIREIEKSRKEAKELCDRSRIIPIQILPPSFTHRFHPEPSIPIPPPPPPSYIFLVACEARRVD